MLLRARILYILTKMHCDALSNVMSGDRVPLTGEPTARYRPRNRSANIAMRLRDTISVFPRSGSEAVSQLSCEYSNHCVYKVYLCHVFGPEQGSDRPIKGVGDQRENGQICALGKSSSYPFTAHARRPCSKGAASVYTVVLADGYRNTATM